MDKMGNLTGLKYQGPVKFAGGKSAVKAMPEKTREAESRKSKPRGDNVEIGNIRQKIAESVTARPQVIHVGTPMKIQGESGIDPLQTPKSPKEVFDAKSPDAATVTFIYDAENRDNLENLTLMGSWSNNTGKYTNKWDKSKVKMVKNDRGEWSATIALLDDGDHDWEYGVKADGPSGKQQWAIFEERNPKFKPTKGEHTVIKYSPTTYTRMGAARDGGDVTFKTYVPNGTNVNVKIWGDDPENAAYMPLKRDPESGIWEGRIQDGWKDVEGKNYAYYIKTDSGKELLQTDPYARYLQGQQKGIDSMYLNPENGHQTHQFSEPRQHFIRFEVQDHPDADSAYLRLYDEQGKPMNKQQLMDKLGDQGSEVVEKFHHGKFNDHWARNVDDSGRIKMTKQGGAFAAIVNNPDKLPGLQYKMEVYEKGPDGRLQLVGDANNDGELSFDEAKQTKYNDRYSPKIIEKFGWQRAGIIKESDYEWKNDDVPRMAEDRHKNIIYQMHVGSVFGDAKNVKRTTLKDVMKRLDYFKKLGVNTLELLPTNTFVGQRDWGYTGTYSFAQSDQYGFYDEKGEWVHGADAVKHFVDAAHGKGFKVFQDVVYNHMWHNDFNNQWGGHGEDNPMFNWGEDPKPKPMDQQPADVGWLLKDNSSNKGEGSETMSTPDAKLFSEPVGGEIELEGGSKDIKGTDWGPVPAYNKKPVSQFIIDNAVHQLDELHFDGIRFDATHLIHAETSDMGSAPRGGGHDGWVMLRKINKEIHFFHPDAITSAEEMPFSPHMTEEIRPNEQGGIGFDQCWDPEIQHRVQHDNNRPGILQQAAHGWKTDMDGFMNHLLHHGGFKDHASRVSVIMNHDQVGWEDRMVNTAKAHDYNRNPNQWERNATRTAYGSTLLSPGAPMMFQGTESLANNIFEWGMPATWDNDWSWLDVGNDWDWNQAKLDDSKVNHFKELLKDPDSDSTQEQVGKMPEIDKKMYNYVASHKPEEQDKALYNIMRKQHAHFVGEANKFRAAHPAFDADAEVYRVYTHNDNSVYAFGRKKDGEEMLVIGSFNKNNLENYNIPLGAGKWKLAFNSDAKQFGGDDYGSRFEVDGHPGSRFDIPKGGFLVYQRVG